MWLLPLSLLALQAIQVENPLFSSLSASFSKKDLLTLNIQKAFHSIVHPGMIPCVGFPSEFQWSAAIVSSKKYPIDLNQYQTLCETTSAICFHAFSSKSKERIETYDSQQDTKGLLCKIAGKHLIAIGLNPKIQTNYEETSEFLQQRPFLSLSHSERDEVLFEAHRKLLQGTLSQKQTHFAGKYRTVRTIILEENERSKEEILEEKIRDLSPAEQTIYGNFLDKLELHDHEISFPLSIEEISILQKLGGVSPSPEKVPYLIHKLWSDLDDLKGLGASSFELAATAHKRLIEAHPFLQGNGRIARVVMNTLLVQEGGLPVNFLREDEYREFSRLSLKEPTNEAFIRYMKASVIDSILLLRS